VTTRKSDDCDERQCMSGVKHRALPGGWAFSCRRGTSCPAATMVGTTQGTTAPIGQRPSLSAANTPLGGGDGRAPLAADQCPQLVPLARVGGCTSAMASLWRETRAKRAAGAGSGRLETF
jgi:hypothetical protein